MYFELLEIMKNLIYSMIPNNPNKILFALLLHFLLILLLFFELLLLLTSL